MAKVKLTYLNPAHAFKSNSNNSQRSKRNADLINNTENKEVKKSRSLMKRLNRKRTMLAKLKPYKPVELKKEIREALNNKEHVIFAGGQLEDIPDDVQGVKVRKFHVNDLIIIDSNEGFRIVDEELNVVATKVPREEALEKRPHGLWKALKKCLDFATCNFTRGIKRLVGVHSAGEDKEAYFCRGYTAYRNKKGIYEKWGREATKCPKAVKKIQASITHCDDLLQKYTDPSHLQGFKDCEKGLLESLRTNENILASIAVGCGSYLNAHKDDDAFLSVITSQAEEIDHYELDADIVTYFCFPDQGYAVALRAGDVLIFNSANVLHCSSSNTSKFIGQTVFNCSIYLKTNVLAGNNNDI